jgi:hypothetical protein
MDGPNVGYCDPPKLEVACFGPAPVHPCSYRSVARTAAAPHTIRDSKTLKHWQDAGMQMTPHTPVVEPRLGLPVQARHPAGHLENIDQPCCSAVFSR